MSKFTLNLSVDSNVVNLCFIPVSLLEIPIGIDILISEESPYFSHYACEILRATDVACKSYKRKRSKSSVTTKFTTFESMDRFNVNFDI